MALASKGQLLAGRYRVLGRLGVGGMAVVVLAEDERLGRKVAVKRLRAESPDDAVRRFEREAKLGASLNHPNIVAVYDIVADDDGVLIAMEYVDGGTLRLEMDSGRMGPARAIEVLCGVAAALDHAHQHGVVHRDVKPANVLIGGRDGAVKLTDLGIATAAERTRITGSGIVLGTAAYLAPERLDGQAGGPASDVYATAALAFEMLSGRKAVTGRTAMEVARRVVEAPPPDLAEVVPGAPVRAAEALKRGMAKDPAERPATVGELVRELSAAYAEAAAPAPTRTPAAPAPTRTPATHARPGWLGPALLALLATAVLLAFLVTNGDDGKPIHRAARPAKQQRSHPRSTSTVPAPAQPAPATALTDFYTRAAQHDFGGAWALGTDNLHAQFNGSIDTFKGTLATLQSIRFPTLQTTSQSADAATVRFRSVAQHTDHTDRCSGQANLVRSGQRWLVDHIGVNCATDRAQNKPSKQAKPNKPKKPKKVKHIKG
jgi:serine/threonine-protein kinase